MTNTSFDTQNVFITVLTNDKYIPGIKALKRSLKNVKANHD